MLVRFFFSFHNSKHSISRIWILTPVKHSGRLCEKLWPRRANHCINFFFLYNQPFLVVYLFKEKSFLSPSFCFLGKKNKRLFSCWICSFVKDYGRLCLSWISLNDLRKNTFEFAGPGKTFSLPFILCVFIFWACEKRWIATHETALHIEEYLKLYIIWYLIENKLLLICVKYAFQL